MTPAESAKLVIEKVMAVGSEKDGCDDSWEDKGKPYHLIKAVRHATTALMIEMGVCKPDGEKHAELAITRLAMAICCE